MTNTRKATTKIASILLIVAVLIGTMCIAGTVTAGAASISANNRVSLYSANPYFSKYGMTTYEVFIQTRDDCSNQKVYVHYNYMDGDPWQEREAEFYTRLSDGSKIWKAYFTSFNAKYCIKYVANGVTYWDNNNGKDYIGGNVIENAPIVSERLGYQYPYQGFMVNALLQNYAYHKNVYVRYTTDGWNSFRDEPMHYSSTKTDGTEEWTTYLPISGSDASGEGFEYAICYQVNGKEYWANNFGENYDRSYYIYH